MGKAAVAKAYSIVQRMDVAKEIAQDVFLKLWQSKGVFPNDKAVYVWIYKTTQRAAIDHLRSASNRYDVRGDHVTDDLLDQKVQVGDAVISRDVVRRYLAKLPEREADIFVYVALDDMSHAEVAELLDVSTKTIQRALQKAQMLFRNLAHDHE